PAPAAHLAHRPSCRAQSESPQHAARPGSHLARRRARHPGAAAPWFRCIASQRRNEMIAKSRVLVVDDEPLMAQDLRQVLSTQGYQVRTAPEGETALSSFDEWRPHLVFTDRHMPRMDGIELC